MKKATERLYFTADRSRLVTHGDPAAAFLAATVGDDIPAGFDAPGDEPAAEKAEPEPAAEKVEPEPAAKKRAPAKKRAARSKD